MPAISIEQPARRQSLSTAELAVVPAGDLLRGYLQHHPLRFAVGRDGVVQGDEDPRERVQASGDLGAVGTHARPTLDQPEVSAQWRVSQRGQITRRRLGSRRQKRRRRPQRQPVPKRKPKPSAREPRKRDVLRAA